ncbi:MAG: type IV pilin protein [Pseudomonadota bacterium]
MKRMRGVTLMELMIVITIIGILAAIAYPSYTEQARRGRRAAAVAMLQNVMQQSERYYSENNTYTTTLTDLGYPAGAVYSEHQTHTIGLAVGPSGDIRTSVSITATPVTADAKCTAITLASDNARTATGSDPTACW